MRIPVTFPEFSDAPERMAGEHVELRPWHDADIGVLAAAFAIRDIAASMRPPVPIGLRGGRQWIDARRAMPSRQRGTSYAITELGAEEAVGSVELRGRAGGGQTMEVGYWMMPSARERGLGREAVDLACTWAFEETNTEAIVAIIAYTNEASQRLVEGLGFVARARIDSNDGWAGDWLLFERER